MGCTNSTCMGSTQSEIEIKQKRSLTSTQELINMKQFDLMQDKSRAHGNNYFDQIPNPDKYALMKENLPTEQDKMRVIFVFHRRKFY